MEGKRKGRKEGEGEGRKEGERGSEKEGKKEILYMILDQHVTQ